MFNTEERVDRLEAAFEQFMAQTSVITTRLDTNLTRLERMVERNIARADQETHDLKKQMGELSNHLDQETHDLKKQMGELGNRLGTIVEDMIVPSIRRIAREELNCGAEKLFLPRAIATRADGRRRSLTRFMLARQRILQREQSHRAPGIR